MKETTQLIIEELKQGIGLSEIARKHGISRQRVHQIKTRPPKQEKTPKEKKLTKKELKRLAEAESLRRLELYEEDLKRKLVVWNEKLSFAFAEASRVINSAFGNSAKLLRFEHVDASGYYFTFELTNDHRRQTYRVGHDEIK